MSEQFQEDVECVLIHRWLPPNMMAFKWIWNHFFALDSDLDEINRSNQSKTKRSKWLLQWLRCLISKISFWKDFHAHLYVRLLCIKEQKVTQKWIERPRMEEMRMKWARQLYRIVIITTSSPNIDHQITQSCYHYIFTSSVRSTFVQCKNSRQNAKCLLFATFININESFWFEKKERERRTRIFTNSSCNQMYAHSKDIWMCRKSHRSSHSACMPSAKQTNNAH